MAGRDFVEVIKDRLLTYRENEVDIRQERKRLERYIREIESPAGGAISDTPRLPSPNLNRIPESVARKMEIEQRLERIYDSQKAERDFFEDIMEQVCSAEEKAIIRLRYFDALEWVPISAIMFGDEDYFTDKGDTYMRHVYRIHGAALLKMAKKIYGDRD